MVKSPPELWAELSEIEGLERHLGEFGEIKITRTEPESTVAWEGESASGTVELEPTGWGTKVTITAAVDDVAEPDSEPESVLEPEPDPVSLEPQPGPFDPEPDPFDPKPVPEPKRRGFFARWMYRERRAEAPAHPAHRLSEFPEEPDPQLPAWSAEVEPGLVAESEPLTEPEPEASSDIAPAAEDEDFEFDFSVRHGEEQPEAEEAPREPLAPERAKEVLETALENLGQAHHRPFSRG